MHIKVLGCGRLVALLAVGSLGLCSDPALSPVPIPKLTVRVFNRSRLSAHVLADALRSVRQTFEAADIEIDWVSCTSATLYAPPASDNGPTGQLVRLTILPEAQLPSPLRADEVFGITSAAGAYVFSGSIGRCAQLYDLPEPYALAAVIAHELAHAVGVGHLSHGLTRGLMSGGFGARDFSTFAQRLRFTPEEAALMRVSLRSTVNRDRGTNHANSGVVRANVERQFTP
jgi:hypothetical protein